MGRGREEQETANQYNGTFVEDEKSEKQPPIANLMAPNPVSVLTESLYDCANTLCITSVYITAAVIYLHTIVCA